MADAGRLLGTPERGVDLSRRLAAQVPRLAAEWTSDGTDPAVRTLDGTLVFADISGFTALSERLAAQGTIGAEELTDVLGRCFAELLVLAYARGGSLLKFGGDALLLLFDGEGHAVRGVDSAIAMRAAMRTVGQLSTSVGRVRLRMSLGVHTGEIHAVRVGGSHRELLLVGPGASTVVTMEGAADAGQIVLSPTTASCVDASKLASAKGPGVLVRAQARPSQELTSLPSFPARRVDGDVLSSVPQVLREHLLAGGGDSEHRHALIAFLHFDGTDAVLRDAGPDALAAELDVLVRDVQRAAATHGVTFLGSDLDHDGGKLILVAGVPRVLGDDEGRLLRAVHEVVSSPRKIPLRVGVNGGRVFAGEVGPPYRRTFTVMGDAVNLAARLMAKAGHGQVLVVAGVLARSRTRFEATALEPFFVKGKRRPVEAFALGATSGTQATRASAQLPLTGREREMSVLEDAWRAAMAGRGRAVVVEGETGVGKSRLVEELRASAANQGAELRLVQCEQYEATTPFFVIRLLVTAVLGGTDDLQERIRRLAPHLQPSAPLIGDVVGAALPETAQTCDLAPRHRRTRTSAAVAELLRAAVQRPALIAFEDAHWMDDASAAVVERLAEVATAEPWLVLISRRNEPGGPVLADQPAVDRLPVGPLDPASVHELVTAATATQPISPQRRAAIVERAEGNALFVEELLLLATSDADAELPSSIEAAVGCQLDRLDPADARLLRVASVLGTTFPKRLLERVLGADPEVLTEIGEDLGGAVARLDGYIVVEADGRLRFRHGLLRDVAYGLLPHRRRHQIHGWAADAIAAEPLVSTRASERSGVLSLHLLHAQRYDECLAHAERAATDAKRTYALVEACGLYERALAAARRTTRRVGQARMIRLWTALAESRQLLGDFTGAEAAYRAAARIDAGPVAAAKVFLGHAEIAERRGRPVAQARWARRGLRVLDGLEGTEAAAWRASLLNHYAFLRLRCGHPRDALRRARQAAAEAERAGRDGRRALATAYTVIDSAYFALGHPERAEHSVRALAIYRRLRDRYNVALLLNNLGAFAYYEGKWSLALERYEEARRTFEQLGNHVDAALGSANIAEIFADQGRLDEAERLLTDVVALWRSLDFPLGLARATRYLARVHLRQGRADVALSLFEEARPTFSAAGLVGNVAEVDVWRAECLLHLGRLAEADALLDSTLVQERSSGSWEMRPMIHRLQAIAAARRDDLPTAWAEIDESLAAARSRGASYDVALALEVVATLAQLGGRPQGEDARREREELMRSLGVVAAPALPIAAPAGG